MRIYVFSDTHRRERAVSDFLSTRKDAVAVIFLGDGLSEMRYVDTSFPDIPFYMVPGNCDFSASGPTELLLELGGVRVLMAHGHTYQVKSTLALYLHRARELGAQVALFGHTHTPLVEYHDGIYLMNPGSVGFTYPRGSYGILDITPQGIMVNAVQLP